LLESFASSPTPPLFFKLSLSFKEVILYLSTPIIRLLFTLDIFFIEQNETLTSIQLMRLPEFSPAKVLIAQLSRPE